MAILNTQPVEKQIPLTDESKDFLSVHSIFPTIQGEGPFVGVPAIFIRLAGCNLRCPACDTDYTTGRSERSNKRIVADVQDLTSKEKLVVITGGEPFRQQIEGLVRGLLFNGYTVQIETNGSLYLEAFPYEHVTIVCSPKTGAVNKRLAKHIAAYKYVIDPPNVDSRDGLPLHALGHPNNGKVAKPHRGFNGDIYLQPIDTGDTLKNEMAAHETARLCMEHGHRLCLQTHKIVGID